MSDLTSGELNALTELHGLVTDESHYDLLGVTKKSTTADIKASYYALSRKFHPDRFHRRNVQEHRELIEEVFTGINRSYELLSDETARRRYDLERAKADRERQEAEEDRDVGLGRRRYRFGRRKSESREGDARRGPQPEAEETSSADAPLPEHDGDSNPGSTQKPKSSIREAAPPRRPPQAYRPRDSPRAEEVKPEETTEESPAESTEQTQAVDENTEERDRRREEFREKSAARVRRMRARRGEGKQSQDSRGGSRNRSKATAHFEEGKREYEAGNFIKAASSLYLAAQFDPGNLEYKDLNEVVQQKARNLRAMQFINQAESAETYGSWREAMENYQKAVDCKPSEGLAYYRLARLMDQKADDSRTVISLFRSAISREPENANFRIALAEMYMKIEMPRNAEREYQAVLASDPTNGKAKAGLRKARR